MRDLTGQKFHKLIVKQKAGANRQGSVRWLCLCECGNEKVYSSDHLTRKSNPVKSCGCTATRKGPEHHQWNGCGEISGDWWYNHVLRERKQSTRAKVPVTVSIEEAWDLFLKQDRKCALSGEEIEIRGMNMYNTASIDRIDSSKGYEIDNIQWVHKDINFMKRTYSQDYFVELCKKIAKNKTEEG